MEGVQWVGLGGQILNEGKGPVGRSPGLSVDALGLLEKGSVSKGKPLSDTVDDSGGSNQSLKIGQMFRWYCSRVYVFCCHWPKAIRKVTLCTILKLRLQTMLLMSLALSYITLTVLQICF